MTLFVKYESNKLLKEESKTPEKNDVPDRAIPTFSNHFSEISRLGESYSTETLLDSITELCFASPSIARRTWQIIFPLLWKSVPSKHHSSVGKYLRQFALALHPAVHHPDVAAFIESLVDLTPAIELKPHHWRYLAQTYALHPLAITQLEDVAMKESQLSKKDSTDIDQPPGQSAADVLSTLYRIGFRF